MVDQPPSRTGSNSLVVDLHEIDARQIGYYTVNDHGWRKTGFKFPWLRIVVAVRKRPAPIDDAIQIARALLSPFDIEAGAIRLPCDGALISGVAIAAKIDVALEAVLSFQTP
jgi:hypothetical protein